MNLCVYSLLALQDMQRFSEGFRGYLSKWQGVIVLLVILLVLVVLVVVLVGPAWRAGLENRRVFALLAGAHRLTPRQARLLRRIARGWARDDWALIFLLRSKFEAATREMRLAEGDAKDLVERLYGGDPPMPPRTTPVPPSRSSPYPPPRMSPTPRPGSTPLPPRRNTPRPG